MPRGLQAVPHDVADEDEYAAVDQVNDVVPIAADLQIVLYRLIRRVELQPGTVGRHGGNEAV